MVPVQQRLNIYRNYIVKLIKRNTKLRLTRTGVLTWSYIRKSKDGLIVLSAPALNMPPEVILGTLNKYHTICKNISSSMKEETGKECPW